jgi:hypothetical protein
MARPARGLGRWGSQQRMETENVVLWEMFGGRLLELAEAWGEGHSGGLVSVGGVGPCTG